jgi:hypothetical protein
LLLDFEVKSVEIATKNVQQKLKEAASQMAKQNAALKRFHENILDSNWVYVRALVLPMIASLENWEKEWSSCLQACDYCRHFILDVPKQEDLHSWFQMLTKLQPKRFPVDHQYENLLCRKIGSLLVSESEPPYTKLSLEHRMQKSREMNEQAIIGEALGLTTERPLLDDVEVLRRNFNEETPSPSNTKKDKKKASKKIHLSSLRTVVLWNKDQLNALQGGKKRIIFDSDFGCGKTLLLKSAALKLAATNTSGTKQDIFFISASAARSQVQYKNKFITENYTKHF